MSDDEKVSARATLDSTLTVQVFYDGGLTRLVANGEIDASSANTFEAAANQALAEAPSAIQIDLSDVGFIDSSGLRAIIGLSNRSRDQHVDLSVSGLSAAARRVLEITGLIDTLRRS
ncbi:MAG: anti-sigma factor antagonist [Ilumatobacteraceae bacterium]|nr:anti-sigma factor antagonist [Ilumatobacteraceae bacterium]